MASELALKFEQVNVHWVILNNEPWCVLADACQALELSNPTMAAAPLDSDEKGLSIIDTLGGPQKMLIVSEPGLYKLIATSRKPVARRFDRWVRHEVLPSIRKTGSYSASILTQSPIDAINDLFDQKLAPVIHKIEEVHKEVKTLGGNVVKLVTKNRRYPTPETYRIHGIVIRHHYFNKCPCDECNIIIMDDDGYITGMWDYHHQYGKWDNRAEATIPLAKECHQRITYSLDERNKFDKAYSKFQDLLSRLPSRQKLLL